MNKSIEEILKIYKKEKYTQEFNKRGYFKIDDIRRLNKDGKLELLLEILEEKEVYFFYGVFEKELNKKSVRSGYNFNLIFIAVSLILGAILVYYIVLDSNSDKIKVEPITPDIKKIEVKENYEYKANARPEDGLFEEYYDSGKLSLKGYYKNGYRIGLWESYHENGQLSSREEQYKGDIRNGLFELYHENGQLKSREFYKDDYLDGLFEVYYENGQLLKRYSYKNKKLNGPAIAYYENGQLQFKQFYKDGYLDGISETYYKTGQLDKKVIYKRGVIVNPQKSLNKKQNNSDKYQKTTSYKISILKDKTFINVRKTPVNCEVVKKVSGDEIYTVTQEFTQSEQIYLLKNQKTFIDIDTGETIEKPSGFKFNNVKNLADSTYSAEIINIDNSINKIIIYESNFKVSNNRWFYLEEIEGWVYSEFCTIIND